MLGIRRVRIEQPEQSGAIIRSLIRPSHDLVYIRNGVSYLLGWSYLPENSGHLYPSILGDTYIFVICAVGFNGRFECRGATPCLELNGVFGYHKQYRNKFDLQNLSSLIFDNILLYGAILSRYLNTVADPGGGQSGHGPPIQFGYRVWPPS